MGWSVCGISAKEKSESLKGSSSVKGPADCQSRRSVTLKCELDVDPGLECGQGNSDEEYVLLALSPKPPKCIRMTQPLNSTDSILKYRPPRLP